MVSADGALRDLDFELLKIFGRLGSTQYANVTYVVYTQFFRKS